MTHVPTLLIGLGGIGSRIVDEVYHRIPPERRDRIAVHAFDTNINDIGHLRYLTADQVTQTSTNKNVGQYLYQAGDAIGDWFPTDLTELHRKLLTEGAGQVRIVSRLAYRAAMEEGKLHKLQRQIRSVFRATGDDLITSVRVMIVCSLAGGTGSGIFLQTALYVRELLAEAFGQSSVLVRGTFLLPDTLTGTNLVDEKEWPNIQSNGYACLKELDALIDNAVDGGKNGVTIELEYRPGSDPVLSRRHLPYDFAFLYDFRNARNQNLVRFGNYIEQAIQAIHLQLFTPLSAESFSVEDNQIRSTIRAGGKNRYCGAGVAQLVYPYEDVVQYCSLRWGTSSLTGQWLKLDADFEEEFRQYERDLQNGIFREKPKLEERYVKLLNQYATADQPDPFFRLVYRSGYRIDEKENLGDAKSDLFVEAIRDRVSQVLENDLDLQQAEVDCQIDEGRIKDKDNAKREVIRVEDSLLYLQREVLKAVYEYKVAVVNEVVAQACDRPTAVRGEAHHLNTWMLGQPDPLHPVAVRYVLYQVLQRLDVEVRDLSVQNEKLLAGIKRYNNVYDLPDTLDFVETPEDRLRTALEQGFLGKIFQNEFKDFVDEYFEKSSRQLGALRRYKQSKLLELVFNDVHQAIRQMLDDWERFFQNLRDVRNRLSEELIRTSKAHEATTDPTRIFVLSSQAVKEKVWDDVRLQFTRNDLPLDIAKQLYLGQYRQFCASHRRERTRPETARATEQLFRESVLAWCEAQVRKVEALNLNVIDAMRREADLTTPIGEELDTGQFLQDRIREIDNLAQPFVPTPNKIATLAFWGIHPDSVEVLNEQQESAWFGEEKIEESAFSRYEIIRYRAAYGLEAADLPKFSAGDEQGGGPKAGAYFRAYNGQRKAMIANPHRVVTSHLDKRWHLPAYMNDIGEAVQLKHAREIRQAFLLGLIYGMLRPAKRDQQEVWMYVHPSRGRPLRVGDAMVPARLHLLLDALTHEPGVVDHVLEDAAQYRDEDFVKYQKSDSPRFHRFYKGTVDLEGLPGTENVLDALLRYGTGVRGNRAIEDEGIALLEAFLHTVDDYYQAYYGAAQQVTASASAGRLIDKLRNEAAAYQSADKNSELFQRWRVLLDAFVDKAAGTS